MFRICRRIGDDVSILRDNISMEQAKAILATYEKTYEKGRNIVWVSGPARIGPGVDPKQTECSIDYTPEKLV